MSKILIGTLTNRGFKAQTVKSLFNLDVPYEKEFEVATQGYHIAENRNYLAFKAINGEFDYLFMVDDDMIFPPCTLTKMLGYKKDVVGVAYKPRNDKKDTHIPLDKVHVDNPDLPKELFECDAVGTGIILIDVNVLKNMPWPFFSFKSDINGATLQGEDWNFCKKVKDKGYKIFCDPTLEIGHIGDFVF